MTSTEPSGRRAFLGQVGRTLLAATGLSLFPNVISQVASAQPHAHTGPASPSALITFTCCTDAQACGDGCGGCNSKYKCVGDGCASYCTGCRSVCNNGDCYKFTQNGC